MKLAAITGSIGCGKTTLSKIVRRLGYVVYDIDGWVRRLYYQKDFIKVIAAHFPEVMEGEKVNKRKLRNLVFGDNARLKVLESLIHPFLKQTLMNVRRRNARRADLFFMDVALLFEMGWDKYCDYIVVADVDYETQKMRVMRRDNISAADFDKINRIQMDNAVREIVFDTETTGFNVNEGDRLVEIGAVELINHIPTGVTYHQYINPEREVPEDAFKVHGLSYDFLKDYPTFRQVADEWLEFVGDAVLVAHNASFDIGFLNGQLKELDKPLFTWDRVVDTLEIARNLFPGARVNLDALCRRYGIDNSERTLHGALLDADLLAKVYLELLGGQEPSMLKEEKKVSRGTVFADSSAQKRVFREARSFPLSEEEKQLHLDFLANNIKEAIWTASAEPEKAES